MILQKYSLDGKVAIITGGGTGLGKSMALLFSQAGASIVVAARRQSLIEQTAEEVKKAGGKAMAVVTDATKSEQVDNMVKKTLEAFGKIDILINNAGLARGVDVETMRLLRGEKVKELWEWTDEEWNTSININLNTAFYCSRAVTKYMVEQKSGVIINLSSVAGLRGVRANFGYCSTKAGIIGFTKCLAITLARYGIRVNCIAPGFMPAYENRDDYGEDLMTKRAYFIPAGRIGEPVEIANVALFLASNASEYITGEVFICDGAAAANGYAPIDYKPDIRMSPVTK